MIYYLTAVVFFLMSVKYPRLNDTTAILSLKQHHNKSVLFFLGISIFWLVLHDGLRWEIGTDWDSYYNFFINNEAAAHYEIGYTIVTRVFRAFTDSYTLYLLAQALFTYIILYHFIKSYSVYPEMSLCIFYCTMIGLMGSNRQLIAIAICLMSVKYVIYRSLPKFLICLLVACCFHTTSMVFVLTYFLYNIKLKYYYVWGIIALCIIINLAGLINNIPFIEYAVFLDSNSAEKLSFYANNDSLSGFSIFGTLKRCLIISAALYCKPKSAKVYNLFLNMYIVGTVIYTLFIGSILGIMAGRGAVYFNISEIILLPYIFYFIYIKMGHRISKTIWLIFFIFLIYMMYRDMLSYVIAYDLNIYTPYKSVLFI